jgi:cystathionine gamma-synthase
MGATAGNEMRFRTRAIHAGQDPEATTGAVSVPIFQTSTYAQPAVGQPKRWDYARGGNPTREALQEVLASLEGGERGFAFGSGLAAETSLLLTLRPGDHVLLGDDVYGGTYRLLSRVLGPWGLDLTPVDMSDPNGVSEAIGDRTRLVWIETPSNPLLRITDISAVSRIAHEAGARVVVDNTFGTPALQRPLELGADAVVHSVTKYIGGHSDLIGGAIVTSDPEWMEQLGFMQNAVGAVPGPMDCFLALRGVKTLETRMLAHCEGAREIAGALSEHAAVSEVFYPGLQSHPGHDVAARQMTGFGGMVSFRVATADDAERIASHTDLFFLAESLGGVESLIEVPGPMTHASVAGSPLEVPPDLIRLSVGLEDPADLIDDLMQAIG